MNSIIRLFHFLGSVYFAIILIASVALIVIVGTFLESMTESHRFAAHFTYGNPVFVALLWGFFINILFSALRRWPFKIKHIPFLITHWGLLMILLGVLVKNYYGLQGNMLILEGTGTHSVLLPDTYHLAFETKDRPTHSLSLPIKKTTFGKFITTLTDTPHLKVNLKEYYPHAEEKYESWIKGDWVFISGLKPFALLAVDEHGRLPISSKAIITPEQTWNLFAARSEAPNDLARQVYIDHTHIKLTEPLTQKVLYEGILRDALQYPLQWNGGSAKLTLETEFESPSLTIELPSANKTAELIKISLTGIRALFNIPLFLGHSPITVEFMATPSLLFIQNEEATFLFAYDAWGRIYNEKFPTASPIRFLSYDRGFGGYAIQAEIPFFLKAGDLKTLEAKQLKQVEEALQQGVAANETFAPPFRLLQIACKQSGVDFVSCCMEFLKVWNLEKHWLFFSNAQLSPELQKALTSVDFGDKKNGCLWACKWGIDLIDELSKGHDLIEILKRKNWPAIESLSTLKGNSNEELILTAVLNQIFQIGEQLPLLEESASNATLLSLYFRLHGLSLQAIMPNPPLPEGIFIETPLIVKHLKQEPTSKLEDNKPKITVELKEDKNREIISLLYDRNAAGFKWPVLDGNYLIRFQPEIREIPYHLRLRQARTIYYPNSAQPYSYESELLITDRRTGETVEKIISMNNVHETWEGYRFYLSNISPMNETSAKRVQLAVNHDPAKYWLTYPGALMMCLGIFLLFWMRPYASS